jgi:hypothetical protein
MIGPKRKRRGKEGRQWKLEGKRSEIGNGNGKEMEKEERKRDKAEKKTPKKTSAADPGARTWVGVVLADVFEQRRRRAPYIAGSNEG